ncbi:MAG: excinuclease ABC subunit UvrC [Pseudomonadota bacterium]|nr:excinuclease ABC subunit UvrC [Pseudomonadota bacterium]MED5341876.1 excinuclease ABC subunit UvrC [Pseudomonadota bacterium]MEE2824400.1 excinuclease ABC subunit UvrC [Pseudomonadota bacterium]
MAFDSENFLKNLTTKSGVYRMFDANGHTLYVGKAKNLRSRVTSYFRAKGLQTKTMAMVAKIADIEITVTASEMEALLLEQNLIKAQRPPYNISLRDDKSYPFVHITGHPEFPQLRFHRGSKGKTGEYFGPYPSAASVRDSLNLLQKLFLVRQCDDNFFRNRSRPCLQYQIQRCSAPCVGHITADEYQQDVQLATLFLQGKSANVLKVFQDKMEKAAEALEFEKAARYRDQISHLRRIQERQYVHGAKGDVDVFALAEDSGRCCVQALFVRNGQVLGQKSHYVSNELAIDRAALLHAFLSQYYLTGDHFDPPNTVLVSDYNDDFGVLQRALEERADRKIHLSKAFRGQRARWVGLAADNAAVNLQARGAARSQMNTRFADLQSALSLASPPRRLECFDISHTMGEATVASCVVFDESGPLSSDYRRFNVTDIVGGDDYAAMEQALTRRYKRLKDGEGQLPDLLVIDGGLGQVNRALQVLGALQLDHEVGVLGIAKGPDRKAGLERFFLGSVAVHIDGHSPAAHLLQHIRDEAHRFAITGHRQRRAKARNQSLLEGIAGVGAKKRRQLLLHFGSISAIKGASIEELSKVQGISKAIAADIYKHFH